MEFEWQNAINSVWQLVSFYTYSYVEVFSYLHSNLNRLKVSKIVVFYSSWAAKTNNEDGGWTGNRLNLPMPTPVS